MAALHRKDNGAAMDALVQTTIDRLALIAVGAFVLCVLTGLLLKGTLLELNNEVHRHSGAGTSANKFLPF